MKTKISITQKHFLYFLLLYVLSTLLVGSYSYYIAKKSILDRTFNQLTSLRVEKSRHLERFFQDRIKEIELVAGTKNISQLFSEVKILKSHNFYILTYLNLLLASNEYYNNILLINKDKESILIDTLYNPEKLYSGQEFISVNSLDGFIDKIKTSKSNSIQDYRINKEGNYSLYFGIPFFDDSSKSLIGIMILDLNVSNINHIMYNISAYNGLGKTGESYIVGNDLLMRTNSRFKENSIKKIIVNSKATHYAFKNKTGTKILKDYRNVDVLSSFAPLQINGLNWVIIAEIDLEEVLQPIYNLRNSIVILCIVVSIFIFGFVYIGSLKITGPIINLKDSANKISQGDYNIILESKSNDEIGELIDSFNIMVNQLSLQAQQIKKDKLLRVRSLIDGQEQERQRLSRDLHDGLGQMLLAIKIKLEQAKDSSKEKSAVFLTDSIELIKATIAEIRTISNDLMPTVLDNFGLDDGIKKLIRDTQSNSSIDFIYNFEDLINYLPDIRKQIYIYRIIQEIINNIVKHSNASIANIQIFHGERNLKLEITDNGIGFDVTKSQNGNGLKNILNRVELLHGECKINSELDKGTKILITIPD